MKVWLYYRLSRDEDEELNSLNNQRKIIYNFAVSNGHEVVGESFDDNVSGMLYQKQNSFGTRASIRSSSSGRIGIGYMNC